ncbi:MAG TPA: response regulator [Nitrospira sp.]|nr:response regulator [Nitrospira sp.]
MPSSILLIDDSPGECELFRQALTQSGYKGRLEISDGSRAAMTYLNDHVPSDEPGLILLDLKLQGERGVDVLKQLKQDARLAPIPVVILTSSDDAADVQACYQAGANGYVVKPGQFDDLVSLSLHLWKFWLEHNCTRRMATSC